MEAAFLKYAFFVLSNSDLTRVAVNGHVAGCQLSLHTTAKI